MIVSNKISLLFESYISYKRSLGFELKHEETTLKNFVNYTFQNDYEGALTKTIVFEWISSGSNKDKTMGRKLEVIRPFMKYAVSFDNKAELIYETVYSNVHQRPVPYIYTEEEVVSLMYKCNELYSPDGIRKETLKIVIGFLWSTGVRPSEVTNLLNQDIDCLNHIINIRNTKFHKERIIPIDSSVSQVIHKYKAWITKKIGYTAPNEALFYTTNGVPLTERSMAYAFNQIRQCIDAKPIGYPNIRLYDFRHTMACRTVKKWLLNNEDVNKKLYILSTYMGHTKPQDTYWYLSATPELMKIVSSKYEAKFGSDFDE